MAPLLTVHNRGLHLFALLTAFSTLLLIVAGGLVTSKGVGMAVPDWPNTFGYNMFFFPIGQWIGGVFYEHTHRLLGSVVGLLTVILALWLNGTRSKPFMRGLGAVLIALALVILWKWPGRWSDAVVLGFTGGAALGASFVWPRTAPAPAWLRRLGILAVVLVIAQGVLGGLRVTQIKDELGIFHGALAQIFFVLICGIVLFTSSWWGRFEFKPGRVVPGLLAWAFLGTTLLIFVQLLIGATMRHQHAGLAIPDFPLAYGEWWPETTPEAIERYNQQRLEIISVKPITAAHVQLYMAHRITAATILLAVVAVAAFTLRTPNAPRLHRNLTAGWASLIGIQVLLGAWTVWSDKAADVATAHVLIGVLSLATGAILCIITFRELGYVRQREAASSQLLGQSMLRPRPQ